MAIGFPLSKAPGRLADALRRRGPRGSAWHALRRLGMKRDRALVGPCKIRINPVNALCNHACPMCWLQHEPAESLRDARQLDRDGRLDLAGYAALFASMPPGMQEVEIVGGGEPMLHPDIAGICRAIKRRGWRGTMYTNGTLLAERLARELVEMGWDCLRVSVHGGDRETYRATQGVDRFNPLIECLKRYADERRRAGPRGRRCQVVLFHVIQRENLEGIAGLFDLAAQVEADGLVFHELIAYTPEMRLSAEETRLACARLEESAARCTVPNNARELARHLAAGLTPAAPNGASSGASEFRPARYCSVGFDQAFVSASGAVKPCCYSDEILGDTRSETFGAIWRGERYQAFRSRLVRGEFAHYCVSQRCSIREVLHD